MPSSQVGMHMMLCKQSKPGCRLQPGVPVIALQCPSARLPSSMRCSARLQVARRLARPGLFAVSGWAKRQSTLEGRTDKLAENAREPGADSQRQLRLTEAAAQPRNCCTNCSQPAGAVTSRASGTPSSTWKRSCRQVSCATLGWAVDCAELWSSSRAGGVYGCVSRLPAADYREMPICPPCCRRRGAAPGLHLRLACGGQHQPAPGLGGGAAESGEWREWWLPQFLYAWAGRSGGCRGF